MIVDAHCLRHGHPAPGSCSIHHGHRMLQNVASTYKAAWVKCNSEFCEWKRRRRGDRYVQRHTMLAEVAIEERSRAATEAQPAAVEVPVPIEANNNAALLGRGNGAGAAHVEMGAHPPPRAAIPLSPASRAAQQAAAAAGLPSLAGVNAAVARRCQDENEVSAAGSLSARDATAAVSGNGSRSDAPALRTIAAKTESVENVKIESAEVSGSGAKQLEGSERGGARWPGSVPRAASESVEGESGRGAEIAAQSSAQSVQHAATKRAHGA
jgi:hypothetical protein